MFRFYTLKCHNCYTVMFNIPDVEVKKFEGLTFRCECCNHLNLLKDYTFVKTFNNDSYWASSF